MAARRSHRGAVLSVLLAGALSLAISLAAGAWGSVPAGSPPSQVAAADQLAQGQVLYQQACSSCHGARGEGGVIAGRVAPGLVGIGPAVVDFWVSTGRMPLATPTAQATRKQAAFNDAQRAAMVAYVASLGPGGEAIPVVDLAHASLVNGGEVYRQNCAACHQAAGIGGVLSYGAFAPSLRDAAPLQVAEAVRTGPSNMPVFGQDTLSDQQLSDLVRYVIYLHHPEDRGGAGLGHSGPIAEGFVGLLGGLGVLILVITWIGTRD
jgi:ubiquinol-cytochrome c reductase cytochrome c subunit